MYFQNPLDMERRDIIKDEIEQLGKVLGKVLARLLNLSEHKEGKEQAQEKLRELCENQSLNLIDMAHWSDKAWEEWVKTTHVNEKILKQISMIYRQIGLLEKSNPHGNESALYLRAALKTIDLSMDISNTWCLRNESYVNELKNIRNESQSH